MAEEIVKWWHDDDTLLNHIETYNSVDKASKGEDEATKKGGTPTGTSATDGHINLGRTVAGAILTGGLSVLAGGSRSEGKVTVSYARTPEWLEEHNQSARESDLLPSSQINPLPTKTSEPNHVIGQLERLVKLKEREYCQMKNFRLKREGYWALNSGVVLAPHQNSPCVRGDDPAMHPKKLPTALASDSMVILDGYAQIVVSVIDASGGDHQLESENQNCLRIRIAS